MLFYQFTPKKGEDSAITSLIHKYTSQAEDWEEINALHTKAMEQAGFDRNLFENASNKHRFVDVAYPEYVETFFLPIIPSIPLPLPGTMIIRTHTHTHTHTRIVDAYLFRERVSPHINVVV